MRHKPLTPLFRVENPSLQFNQPEGDYFARELAGQWFDLTIDGAFANLSRVTWFSLRRNAPAQLAIAVVASSELEDYSASNHPIASAMNHFSDDYIIPRDGSIPVFEIDIDNIVRGEVSGYPRDKIRKLAAPVIRKQIGRGPITRFGRVL
jgi:hypothetical protein